MLMVNDLGEKVYYNDVVKRGEVRFIIKAASGQVTRGRDGQKLKSRTFAKQHQAEAWLDRNGYRSGYR